VWTINEGKALLFKGAKGRGVNNQDAEERSGSMQFNGKFETVNVDVNHSKDEGGFGDVLVALGGASHKKKLSRIKMRGC